MGAWTAAGVQALLDAAQRHATAMADAMVAACLQWANDHDCALDLAPRATPARPHRRQTDAPDFARMVERNSDTRLMHC